MSFNLLSAASGLFTPDFIGKSASLLGETPNDVQKAVSGLVPSVLTGLLHKADSGGSATNSIFNMANKAASSGILTSLNSVFDGTGYAGLTNMASDLFGDRLGNVINSVAGFSGIKQSSTSSLMNLAVPAVLGALGKHASTNNLSSGQLGSLLNDNKDAILNAVPSGLGLANALGVAKLSNIGIGSRPGSHVIEDVKKGTNWLMPLLLLLAATALILYILKGCGSKVEINEPVTTVTVPAAEAPAIPAAEVPNFKVILPGGIELNAFQGGIEDKLVAFLNDPNSIAGKDVWFDFDHLNFETNSDIITPESQPQVNNIAAILSAFPSTEIKIGGYTDVTGDATTNKKLSQDRADAVVAALKAAGASEKQISGAEGYGSQFAKAAADAPDEEKKKDRRISVSVRKK